MNKKELLSQATRPSKRIITIQDLPTQLLELSEKDLQQIVGRGGSGSWEDRVYSL
jgi:bacteriocin-like protein